MRLTKTVFGIALLPVVVTGGVLMLLLHQLDATQEQREYERRARKALDDDLRVADALVASGLSLLKYATDLDQESLDRVRMIQDRVPPVVGELDKVCIEPATRDTAYESASETAGFFSISEELIWSAPLGETDFCPIRTLAIRQGFKPQADRVVAVSERLRRQIIADSQRLPRSSLLLQSNAPQYQQWGLLATALGSLTVAGLLGRNIIGRLAVIQDNSTRLPRGQTLQAPLAGNDEIADLDRTFHMMADELAVARKKEQEAVDNSADVILAIDQENRLRRVSAAVKEWGYTPEQLDGQHVSVLFADDAVPALQNFLADLRGKDGAGTLESRVSSTKEAKDDGKQLDVLLSAQFSKIEGLFFCVVHDISERKLMEQLLADSARREELLLERVPAALLMFGDDLLIKDANAAAAELFTVEQSSQLIGKPVTSLLRTTNTSTESSAEFIADLRKRASGKGFSIDVLRGEDTITATMSVDEIPTGAGKMFLAVLLDQTERQALGKLKARLWNMIANDIAAPLTTINSRLHMFGDGACGALSESGQRRVEAAEVESQRLMRLFQDLLRVEKDDDVQLSIGTEECALADVIDRAVQATQVQAENAGVRIEAIASPVKLRLDADRMVQVFVNLLTNAVKFSPAGTVITIAPNKSAANKSAANKSAADKSVTVEVSDQGVGIPEAMLDRVFQPFVQARLEDSTVKGGSGLGLAICKRIVEAHGGTITVRNNADRGCTFEVRLPNS